MKHSAGIKVCLNHATPSMGGACAQFSDDTFGDLDVSRNDEQRCVANRPCFAVARQHTPNDKDALEVVVGSLLSSSAMVTSGVVLGTTSLVL